MKTNSKQNYVFIIAVVLVAAVAAAIIYGFNMPKQEEIIQGQAETGEYRVSSKVPGRVLEIRVKEGDKVSKGDTLAILEAPDIQAKLAQANAAVSAAEALDQKAQNGAQKEQVQSAYEMWQKAKAGVEVAEKTYNRVNRLFENGVMAEQKRDEAKAQYDAMVATEKAARAQYEMAKNGARKEDKAAAGAQLARAQGAVKEVASYINETVLIALADGEVTEIFPKLGELVGTGAPVMNVAITDDVWFSFNIREDKLTGIKVGDEMEAYIPAMDKTIKVKITLIKNVGSFATWKATKALDGFDLKTFEVQAKPVQPAGELRSGMSIILKK